jgi:hypothetical protein
MTANTEQVEEKVRRLRSLLQELTAERLEEAGALLKLAEAASHGIHVTTGPGLTSVVPSAEETCRVLHELSDSIDEVRKLLGKALKDLRNGRRDEPGG